MRRPIFSIAAARICTFTVCVASSLATNAQVPDRVNLLIQQARGLAKSAQDSTDNHSDTVQNPFSRGNAARPGAEIQGSSLESRPDGTSAAVGISDSAITIQVGGQNITVPRTGPNGVQPNGQSVGHNHLASPLYAQGRVTINGQPVGGCLLNRAVAISESTDVTIDRNGKTISSAAYRELAAGLDSFGRADFATAAKHLEKCIAANPNDPLPHPFYSLTLFAIGNYDEAAEYAYSAAATSPVWDWNQLQSYYADPTHYANQYEQLQIASRQATARPGTHFLLAWHHLMLGHRAAAQAELERVLQQMPNDPLVVGLMELARQPISAPPQPMD
jgi:tetratricopeptide (TPR) repeat protein